MSQYSYACLIERSNLQNKENTMQVQFSNGSRETCGNGPTFNNTFYVQILYRTHSSLNSLWLRRIGEDLHECLPNLESLVLSNNSMTELGDLDPLSNLKSLQHLRYEFLLSD